MIKPFDANISTTVSNFFRTELNETDTLSFTNNKLFTICGIKQFFTSDDDLVQLFQNIDPIANNSVSIDRTEYGDFQTNLTLATDIVILLRHQLANPQIIVEPTCGTGTFIIACLNNFEHIEKIVGVEIYIPYVWETKFNILKFFIDNPYNIKPEIEINNANSFDFDFDGISTQYHDKEILVIGNPPWVTNTELSKLSSNNLPIKTNLNKLGGLDAITGKGNFDIGECISMRILDAFQHSHGNFAFLIKNSVIKNIVHNQPQRNYKISNLQKLNIDTKKEFGVSVKASLFICKFNTTPDTICDEFDFYNPSTCINRFGWKDDKFVSNIGIYDLGIDMDGISPFIWRQGVKHDCSSIMEFDKVNDSFVNKHGYQFDLEDDLVYGVLKSSDLKQKVINVTRKYTIITQKKVGQDTSFIKKEFPKTYKYLSDNKLKFDTRKSTIYNNKPDYSIFGIGDYSFAPYKITISGLYKNYFFNLVLPQNGKPIMLDDTCYLLGFNDLDFAYFTYILLNSKKSIELLHAITFTDAKRTFTKDILMRINILKIAQQFSEITMIEELNKLNQTFDVNKWNKYIELMSPIPQI